MEDTYDHAFSNLETWVYMGAFAFLIMAIVLLLAARGLLTDDMDD